MDYYCEICEQFIKPKSKNKHFKSNIHEEFDICQHRKLTIENPDINDVDRAFFAYIIEHKKKFDYCLMKYQYKLVFNDYQYYPYIASKLADNKTRCSWYKVLQNVSNDFKIKGYNFNHIAEMNAITIAKKLDMSYEFHTSHNMHAVEWKFIAMMNKNEKLVNKLDRIKRLPLITKISRSPICN